MAKNENTVLAKLEQQREALANKLSAARAAAEQAMSARRSFLLSGAVDDMKTRAAVDQRVISCQAAEVGLEDALEQIDLQIESKNYGGRNIKICARWRSFENFFNDMGRKPTAKHSIDRINNNGNYTPKNCKWSTAREQRHNRRDNVWLFIDGRRLTVAEAAEQVGLNYKTLHARLWKGWPVEEALNLPWPPQSSIDSAVRHLRKRMKEIKAAA
jgi:hypothetical protein